MGLDQYVYSDNHNNEIGYFRKHANLQGYMEEKWREQTGNFEDSFNCIQFELSEEVNGVVSGVDFPSTLRR